MNTWILLLMIGANNQQSPSVTAVPGFLDAGSCKTAGKAWVEQHKKVNLNATTFVCVATKSI